ncbi:MAG: transcription antitermination factor NusB [Clostridia bacterium]|nr:transcription antitermination factor NusB [Clostridia bacterium]
MNRREARELVFHLLFSAEYTGKSGQELLQDVTDERFASLREEYALYSELPPQSQEDYIRQAVTGVVEHREELDEAIRKYAVGWNLSRITAVSRCLLRLSMYEMREMKIPVGASVNEALELAKRYDSDEAAAILNGILGSCVREEVEPQA